MQVRLFEVAKRESLLRITAEVLLKDNRCRFLRRTSFKTLHNEAVRALSPVFTGERVGERGTHEVRKVSYLN